MNDIIKLTEDEQVLVKPALNLIKEHQKQISALIGVLSVTVGYLCKLRGLEPEKYRLLEDGTTLVTQEVFNQITKKNE